MPRKKALLVGINYFGTDDRLYGCINDIKAIKDFISERFAFDPQDMKVLTDDQTGVETQPTRNNIVDGLR